MRRLPGEYRSSLRAIAEAHAADLFDVFHAQYRRLDRAITAAAAAGARLVVAGDGPDRARLEALARARRVEATFLGSVTEVESVYHSVDALIFGALAREGFSLTLLEAAATHCPIIGFAEDRAVATTLADAGAVVLGAPEDLATVDRTQLARAAANADRWVQHHDVAGWRERCFAVLAAAAADGPRR